MSFHADELKIKFYINERGSVLSMRGTLQLMFYVILMKFGKGVNDEGKRLNPEFDGAGVVLPPI